MPRLCLLVTLTALCCHATIAAAAEPESAIKQLLTVGWQKQYSARAESDALFQQFTRTHGVDRRMTHAYALVLLQQGRYAEAQSPLRSAVKLNPTSAAPRRSLIRDLILLKQYQAALTQAETLSEQLGKLPVKQEPTDDAFKSAALLGRMVAYFSGPGVQPTLKQELRRLTESTNLWPLELKQEFDQASDDVAQLHAGIQAQIAQFQEKTEKELEEQREFLAESVTERKEELKQRQGEIEQRAEKVEEEARSEYNALVAQEQPLAARYAELERRAILIRRDLAPVVFDINQLLIRAEETESPIEREILLSRVDRLERIAARYEADLSALGREAARLESQLGALRRQQASINARFANDQGRLAQEQKGIQRGEKILQNDRRKLAQGLEAPTGGLRSLTRQLAAYTTYDAFDLVEQRQEIMASLAD